MGKDNTSRIEGKSIPQVSSEAVEASPVTTEGPIMKEQRAKRLRAAREKAGYASAADAARAFGWTESAYRHHENATRGFGLDHARTYGRAFKVKPGWLLCMEGVDDTPVEVTQTEGKLIVEGAVEAGVWREPADYRVKRMEIDIPPPVPDRKRFGLIVEGLSMNVHYEPGTVLDCISIFKNGVRPETGDHVIVERIKADGLRETTVKEFVEREGRYFLAPKSTRPEFKEMEIGAPDVDIIDDVEVRVIGFVVSAIAPRALDLMRRLGRVQDLPSEE